MMLANPLSLQHTTGRKEGRSKQYITTTTKRLHLCHLIWSVRLPCQSDETEMTQLRVMRHFSLKITVVEILWFANGQLDERCRGMKMMQVSTHMQLAQLT